MDDFYNSFSGENPVIVINDLSNGTVPGSGRALGGRPKSMIQALSILRHRPVIRE